MCKRFYILRHGLTEKPGVLLGRFDARLSAEGIEQARQIANKLAGTGIERILSSTLARALETAGPAAGRLGLDLEIDDRLTEISYGRWDGLTWSEIEQIDGAIAMRKLKDWWSATPPGGESAMEFVRRVEQSWNSLLDHPANATLVVAHEAVNAVLVEMAQHPMGVAGQHWKPNWARISNFRQPPGTYHTLDVEAKQRRTTGPG